MSWYIIATPRHQERLVKQNLSNYWAKVFEQGYGG